MHRLFIAINLPDEIKQKISFACDRLSAALPRGQFRFLTPQAWHLTIVFLGDQPDEAISGILRATEQVAHSCRKFPPLQFEKINYAPNHRDSELIWLTGSLDTSQFLGRLRDQLTEALIYEDVQFRPDNRLFTAHITLARRADGHGLLAPLHEPLPLLVPFQHLDLMESFLKPHGAEYDLLAQSKVG